MKVFRISLIFILLLSILLPLLPGNPVSNTKPVYAAGYTSVNVTGTRYWMGAGNGYNFTSDAEMWAVSAADSGYLGSGTTVGWYSTGTSNNYDWIKRDVYRFDVGSYLDKEIISIKFWLYMNRAVSSYWLDDYLVLSKAYITNAAPVESDWGYLQLQAVAPAYLWNDIGTGASAWYSIDAFDSQLDEIMDPSSSNYTFISGLSLFDKYGHPITWYSSQAHYISMDNIIMEITYAEDSAEREMNVLTNAADYGGALLGTENVTGISWLTPRAAFADDINGIGFRVEGNPGAAFSYQLVDSTGTLLDSGNNTIKSNNYFYWYYEPEIGYTGWVKLKVRLERDNTLTESLYGRIEAPPDLTQRTLTVNAYDTAFPQYDNELNSYIVYRNDVGILYWKTNLETADMNNYSIALLSGGDSGHVMYSANMSTLNSDYFQVTDSANEDMAHWRYLMFTPAGSSINRYDDMIIYLGKEYTLTNCGFWQGIIRLNSDNSSLTWTDTAHFYINSIEQGLQFSIQDSDSEDGMINAIIDVGEHCKIASRLPYLSIAVINELGAVLGYVESFVVVGNNNISFPMPEYEGEYEARFTFYDSELVPDYEYIHDVTFTLISGASGAIVPGTPPSESGIVGWINGILRDHNMDNAAGHWLLIIILCVIVAAVFGVYGKMPLVATVICILIFGFALWAGWVDRWIIVLLAIAAGFTIWRLFRKQTGSGSTEENIR